MGPNERFGQQKLVTNFHRFCLFESSKINCILARVANCQPSWSSQMFLQCGLHFLQNEADFQYHLSTLNMFLLQFQQLFAFSEVLYNRHIPCALQIFFCTKVLYFPQLLAVSKIWFDFVIFSFFYLFFKYAVLCVLLTI